MFSDFFHRISRNHRSSRGSISADTAAWPREWLTIVYKVYAGATSIPLLSEPLPRKTLFEAFTERKSGRDFSNESLSLNEVSSLLLYACGMRVHFPQEQHSELPETHRVQPSAGGLYPIEAYVVNFRDGALPAGVFHYNVKEHTLETLEKRSFSGADLAELFVESSAPTATPRFMHGAACAIVLTAVFDRTQNKYGERGYRYCLLEAGHIGQNLSLTCATLGLSCTMIGGVVDEGFDHLIRVDGAEESTVYVGVIGRR